MRADSTRSRRSVFTGLLVLWAALAWPGAGWAHESDTSALRLRIDAHRIDGEWEMHLRDARLRIGLADTGTGPEAWDELVAARVELLADLSGRLRLSNDGRPCETALGPEIDEQRRDADFLIVPLRGVCPEPVSALGIGYALLFDLDEGHRAFLAVEDARATHIGTLTAAEPAVVIAVAQPDRWREFRDYVRAGVGHILTGWDHLAFLLALLLVAPLVRVDGAWQPREGFGPTLRQVAGVVTAFTLAHAVTLSAAVLGYVRFPSRPVEAAIALSIFLAAWNNLRPFARTGIGLAAVFGLVHGLGFASFLTGMGLPRTARGLALLSFNLGVELGQLAFVLAVVPLLWAVRRTAPFRRVGVVAGSFALAWLAVVWLVERLFGLALLPG